MTSDFRKDGHSQRLHLPVVIIRGFDNFDKLRDTKTGINPLLRPKEFDVFRN